MSDSDRSIAVPARRVRRRWPEIALIGRYPPPYGGVTVHLQRLSEYLESRGEDFVLYSLRGGQRPPNVIAPARSRLGAALWMLRFCLRHRCRIVHLHTVNWTVRLLFGLAARRRIGRYVLSVQGRSISEKLANPRSVRGGLTRWFLRRMDAVIACNARIERECLEIVGLPREKVHMIPAFIPPSPQRSCPLPEDVSSYLDVHRPVLCGVGAIGVTYRGREVYGVDMMVELIRRLRADFPQIGLVVPLIGGQREAVGAFIDESRRRVGEAALLIPEALPDISVILRASDLFLRPTNTDGDAVSIREALWEGTPVVASDAVPRPEPCVLFATRDDDDFETKVRAALADLPALKRRARSSTMPNNADRIMQVYSQLRSES